MKTKITLCCFVALLFILCVPNIACAKENDTDYAENIRVLTDDEAIECLMENLNLSREEAEARIVDNRSTRDARISDLVEVYFYTGPDGYKVKTGGVWELYSQGSFRQFTRCLGVWAKAAQSGPYEWKDSVVIDLTAEDKGYPYTRSILVTSGTIEVAIDVSESYGVDYPGLGFSYDKTVGQTIYYRKDLFFETIWDLWTMSGPKRYTGSSDYHWVDASQWDPGWFHED